MAEPMSTEREAQIRALGDDEFRDVLVMDDAVDDLLREIDRLRALLAAD
jgi:hypothetical protein